MMDQEENKMPQKPEENIDTGAGPKPAEQENNPYGYSYQQNQYQNNGYNPNYAQYYNEDGMDTRPLSMGEWALTLLALILPCCIGIILYIVWAFSKKGNVNRRNFCRAYLIIMAVVVVIYLIVIVLFGSAIFGAVATQVQTQLQFLF